MAGQPLTYANFKDQERQRGLADAEYANINQVGQESDMQIEGNRNPMLQAYMAQGQQGLNPVPSPVQSQDPITAVTEAVLTGQVRMEDVIANPTIPEQDKQMIVESVKQATAPQPQMGLNPMMA